MFGESRQNFPVQSFRSPLWSLLRIVEEDNSSCVNQRRLLVLLVLQRWSSTTETICNCNEYRLQSYDNFLSIYNELCERCSIKHTALLSFDECPIWKTMSQTQLSIHFSSQVNIY